MSYDYSGLQATATRLINNFGKPVVFSREAGETYDPVTGVTPGTTETVTGKGVQTSFESSEIDGTTILATDVKLLFEPGVGAPAQGDTATIDSVVYKVVNAMLVHPGDTVMLYKVQLRKS